MSVTVTISGNKSELTTYFQPPLSLSNSYECGLLYFFVFNPSHNFNTYSIISIECDLVQGSYSNGFPTHIIHEFMHNKTTSACLTESPKNIVYFPINKKVIPSITVKILDQFGNCINFKEERIQLQLHLRKQNDNIL